MSKLDPRTGETRLQMLLAIKKQTGIVAPELVNRPKLPEGTEQIWDWFCHLGRARENGFSREPITWPQMHAYFQLMRVIPQRWEVEALRLLDDAYMGSFAKPTARVANAAALKQRMTGKRSVDNG